MDDDAFAITYQDICLAVERLRGHAHHTPIHQSSSFNAIAGVEAWFKCEQFQRTGAFKFRGVYNYFSALDLHRSIQKVVTISSGNHAQAVALCAALCHISAVVYMPEDASLVKVSAAQGYGAQVIHFDRRYQRREDITQTLLEQYGDAFIPSSNHAVIIAGQGTAAVELLRDMPELDVVVVPVGGGGLIAGTCIAARTLCPSIHIVGVQTEAANHGYLSLQRSMNISILPPETIADGLCTTVLGSLTWPVIRHMVDDIILVSEEDVWMTLRFLLFQMKLLVEPTGAVAAAAALTGKLRRYGRRVGILLSGGNIAPQILYELLSVS